MKWHLRLPAIAAAAIIASTRLAAQPLPFDAKVETYRSEEGDITAFVLRLEQPFLAEEFEKSNKLRLEPVDQAAYLIYPKEARFERKHAEFYGRLRDEGRAKVRLAYEVVSEDLAGRPQVDVRTTEIEIPIPAKQTGIDEIYKAWARQQNAHFAELLRYYPETSFFEYVLLQSRDRYGIEPPPLPTAQPRRETETGLYHTFSGGLALQQSLQWETLRGERQIGDLTVHVSALQPPQIRSLDYEALLAKKREEGVEPQLHELAKFVPQDQYFLHVQSMHTAGELIDLSQEWGESLLRLFTVNARDHRLQEKYEDQLCVRRDALTRLFADEIVSEAAVTGSDFFVAEGTDMTLLFQLTNADVFRQAADEWLAQVKEKHREVVEREVNYRGHRISARYTPDRQVSSFLLYKDGMAVFSNSPVAMRRIIDASLGVLPNLYDALDFQYVTTLLPPQNSAKTAYLYGSEAFLKYLVSPKFKIAEKRRLQAFNNLIMLNNASMFYRLEYGQSPGSLTDLVRGNFYDPQDLVDPTGGAYAWDASHDTATSSIYNRIKYLTPIVELDVLQVSQNEEAEYQRYRQRYEAFWQTVFDPVAIRMTVDHPRVKLETLVLPFANGSSYADLRQFLSERPAQLGTHQIARSAVLSAILAPGREKVSALVQEIPGVREVLAEDPTLTDLSWLGDCVSFHFLDDHTILEVDPTRLERLEQMMGVDVSFQVALSALLASTNLPIYATIDVEDEDKAARLLDQLRSRIILKGEPMFGLPTEFDAYRLPRYKEHDVYVLSYQIYALKVRLHVALVKGRLVAATQLDALHEAIDASLAEVPSDAPEAHALLRLNLRAMDKLAADAQLYWNEKLREAAHRNIMPIYNLIKLYNVPMDGVNDLADAKYGVRYFCPGGGEYRYDAASDQVYSTVYGNRQDARQPLAVADSTAFAELLNGIDEMVAALRFTDDGLIGTVEIARRSD
jgi:hypothetical protein